MMSEAGAAPVDPAPPAPAPAPAPAHALLDTSWPVRAWVGASARRRTESDYSDRPTAKLQHLSEGRPCRRTLEARCWAEHCVPGRWGQPIGQCGVGPCAAEERVGVLRLERGWVRRKQRPEGVRHLFIPWSTHQTGVLSGFRLLFCILLYFKEGLLPKPSENSGQGRPISQEIPPTVSAVLGSCC